MKVNQTLEECKRLAETGNYGVIPLATEIYGDAKTPIEILRILKRVSRHVYLLESADSQKRWSRYSFLGYDPLLELSCRNGVTTIKTSLTTQQETKDVRTCIREIMKDNTSPQLSELPGFTGGLVGYFSYDYIKYAEPGLKLDAKDEEGFSDVNLMLFHKVIAFDHFRQKIILITNIKTDDLEINYHKALLELENTKRLIETNPGFKSRIREYVYFPDYNDQELGQIFNQMANDLGFAVDHPGMENFTVRMQAERAGRYFGNARTVRNVLDECINRHSLNLKQGVIGKAQKFTITGPDVSAAVKKEFFDY